MVDESSSLTQRNYVEGDASQSYLVGSLDTENLKHSVTDDRETKRRTNEEALRVDRRHKVSRS